MKRAYFFYLFFCLCTSLIAQEKDAITKELATFIEDVETQLEQYMTDEEKLIFLDSITESKELARDKKLKIKLSKQTIRLARKLENYDIIAKKSRFILQDLNVRNLQDSVIILANALIKEKNKLKDSSSLAHIYLKRAGALYKQAKHTKAIVDYEKAAVIFEANSKPLFAADGYFFAGQSYLLTHDYASAIAQMKKALELYELGGDVTYVQYVAGSLSDLYDRIGLVEKGYNERTLFLKKYKNKVPAYKLSDLYEEISNYYYNKKQFDVQKVYLDSAYAEISKVDDPDVQAYATDMAMSICNSYVRHYLATGNLENAELYLNKADAFWQNSGAKEYYETSMFLSRARFLKQKKQYSTAGILYQNILNRGSELHDIWQRVNALDGLAEIREKQGDYKNAVVLRKDELKLRDSLDKVQQKSKLLFLQTEFETERREKELAQRNAEIKSLELEQTIARNKRVVLSVILIFVVIIAVIAVYLIWQRGKIRRQRLEREVEYKKKDLKYFALDITQKREWALELIDKIKIIKEATGKKRSIELDKLNTEIKDRIRVDENTELFYEKVESLGSSFYENLRDKYPKLTKTDMRLCTLIRMNLETKQIAILQNINPSSVKMSRNRLRKKLNLDSDVDLYQFLSAF
jgi:DNA-binding CsgD family transcriptional regulator